MYRKSQNLKLDRPNVGILIRVYKPNLELFFKLLDSIRNQTYSNWHVYIYVDDDPDFTRLALEEEYSSSKFTFIYNNSNLGIYKNFEKAILNLIQKYDYLFLSDQDDIWNSRKIEKMLEIFANNPRISLVYSDARIVDGNGNLIANSLFKYEKRKISNRWQDLIIKNIVSGTTISIRSSYMFGLLPFPENGGWQHDVWIAIYAAYVGTIEYLPEPLIDYVQHENNTIGAQRKDSILRIFNFRNMLIATKIKYALYSSLIMRLQQEKIIKNSSKPKYSHQFLSILFHPKLRQTDFRYYFQFVFGLPILLVHGVWQVMSRMKLVIKRIFNFAKSNGLSKLISKTLQRIYIHNSISHLDHNRSYPIQVQRNLNGRNSIYLILPAVEFPIFGGVATALIFAAEMIQKGLNVKVVTLDKRVDKKIVFEQDFFAGYPDYKNLIAEMVSKSEFQEFYLKNGDILVSTAWWTTSEALKLARLFSDLDIKVINFAQDFECNFEVLGDQYASILREYREVDDLILNSATLGKYFNDFVRKIDNNLVFAPTPLFSREKTPLRIPNRNYVTIVFYGRPSVPRNLFNTAIQGLHLFSQRYDGNVALRIISIGEKHVNIILPNNREVISYGALSYEEYDEILSVADIGLSLMLSPHPSYPPLEMLNKGLKVITNDFMGYKTNLSNCQGLHIVEPNPNSISDALLEIMKEPLTRETYELDTLGLNLKEVANNFKIKWIKENFES